MKILNFGSLNLDLVFEVPHFVRPGETLFSKHMQIYCGGKGLNQSIALAKAGASVYHAGLIGPDGERLVQRLREFGVDTGNVSKVDVPSGQAIIQVDENGQNCILLFGGANQQIPRQFVDETLESFAEGDLLLLQNEISNLDYIMRKAGEKRMKIALNTAPYSEQLKSYPLQYVNYFIMNEIEGREMTGESDPTAIAQQMTGRYPGCAVILTLGELGSVYLDGHCKYEQGIYKAAAVEDTTAAGDTFTGYFLTALSEGKSVPFALDLAAKAASICVSVKGASDSIPFRNEVESAVCQPVL